jgi:predicted RNA-binding protein associated with RNAse of E/G family
MFREIDNNSNLTEIQKSQFLRVVDVLFLGPLLIYASMRTNEKPLKSALLLSGVLVIANNATNFYLNIKKSA